MGKLVIVFKVGLGNGPCTIQFIVKLQSRPYLLRANSSLLQTKILFFIDKFSFKLKILTDQSIRRLNQQNISFQKGKSSNKMQNSRHVRTGSYDGIGNNTYVDQYSLLPPIHIGPKFDANGESPLSQIGLSRNFQEQSRGSFNHKHTYSASVLEQIQSVKGLKQEGKRQIHPIPKHNEALEGALTWKAHIMSKPPIDHSQDFKKLNMLSVKNSVQTRNIREFRKEHDLRVSKNSTSSPSHHHTRSFDYRADETIYGRPGKPQTPMDLVMSHEYMKMAAFENQQAVSAGKSLKQLEFNQRTQLPRNTKAIEKAHEFVRQRITPGPKEGQPLFKLKAFQGISPKIDNKQTIKLSADLLQKSFDPSILKQLSKKSIHMVRMKNNASELQSSQKNLPETSSQFARELIKKVQSIQRGSLPISENPSEETMISASRAPSLGGIDV